MSSGSTFGNGVSVYLCPRAVVSTPGRSYATLPRRGPHSPSPGRSLAVGRGPSPGHPRARGVAPARPRGRGPAPADLRAGPPLSCDTAEPPLPPPCPPSLPPWCRARSPCSWRWAPPPPPWPSPSASLTAVSGSGPRDSGRTAAAGGDGPVIPTPPCRFRRRQHPGGEREPLPHSALPAPQGDILQHQRHLRQQ